MPHFDQPFWLLLLIPLAAASYRLWRRPRPALALTALPTPALRNWRARISPLWPALRLAALTLLIAALARPQLRWQESVEQGEGIDIMLAMDLSVSMLSRDFDPDRLEVAKRLAVEFVSRRTFDRVGLVVFSGEAFTRCPLTTDRQRLAQMIYSLQPGRIEHGTAIGMGLATALNRLRNSQAPSKVIVLLTDGENNAGEISPIQAAEIARDMGVRLYVIGVGSDGLVLTPEGQYPDGSFYFAPRYTRFDTETLEKMAQIASGMFYRATDAESLAQIYAEIDRLEKGSVEVIQLTRTREMYRFLLFPAIFLLFAEQLWRWLIFRTITP
ncbi:MAG: vWA domain-containing protein [Saprospiraceae bacterium]